MTENTAKKFHILVLWLIHLTETTWCFYILIYTDFINLCYSESPHNCIFNSGINRGSWLHFIFARCSAFLVCIWLNNLGKFCSGCNQENIKLLSSRWSGRTGCERPLGKINVLFCSVWYTASFWFLLLGLSFLLLFVKPLREGNITGALKIACWTTMGWRFGYKNFLWARWLCLWLTLFRSVYLILALFQVKKCSLFQKILLIYKILKRCQWGRIQTHMAYSNVPICSLTPDMEMGSKSRLLFVKGTETY